MMAPLRGQRKYRYVQTGLRKTGLGLKIPDLIFHHCNIKFWKFLNFLWFRWKIPFYINRSSYEWIIVNHKLWWAQESLSRIFFRLVNAHFWLDIYSVKISEIGVNLDNPPKTITWRRISKHYCRHRRRFLHVYSWISLTSENCSSFKRDHLRQVSGKK